MTSETRTGFELRPLTDADAQASAVLRHEAFGSPRPSGDQTLEGSGVHWLGTFAGATLAARMVTLEYAGWFGGAAVAMAGIGGVTVAPEYRGRGLLVPMFTRALGEARERGAVVSTLFPTASAIYRRFGYEAITDYLTVRIPTTALAGLRVPHGMTLRRATSSDMPAVRAAYSAWARQQNGPLTRQGHGFDTPDESLAQEFSGISLIERDSQVYGFASWDRSQGYGDHAHVFVHDLVAADGEALRGLLALLGSFAAVTGEIRLQTSGLDIVRAAVPTIHWEVTARSPYMLRLLDVPGALSARIWPGLDADVEFSVADRIIEPVAGDWHLAVSGGTAAVEKGIGLGPTFTPAGLALLYAGAMSCANLRRAGHLSGPAGNDLLLDALFAGYEPHIRDYF